MTKNFTGFQVSTFEFLTDLSANNTKEWFTANRARYEDAWLQPALDFAEAIESAANSLTPPHKAQARVNGSVRRIFRDTRFSKDKTPYNPRMHLVFWTGDHPNRSPAIHLVLGKNHFGFGAGQWGLGPQQLASYRNAVCAKASRDELLSVLKKAKSVGCDLGEPGLKRVPKGFEIDEQHAHLLKHKSMVVRTLQDREIPLQLQNSDCISYCASLMMTLAPVNAWLMKNL